jgi:hypothetical protein
LPILGSYKSFHKPLSKKPRWRSESSERVSTPHPRNGILMALARQRGRRWSARGGLSPPRTKKREAPRSLRELNDILQCCD